MYKQEVNDLRMQVSLNGYKIQLTMGSHSRGRVYQRTNCDVSDVFHRIALLLENPSVSEYITLDVKIGDNCVIFDGDTGLSYALAVEETEITVKTVYCPQKSTDVKKVGKDDFCMFVLRAEVLCADVFRNIQPLVYNLAMGLGQHVVA